MITSPIEEQTQNIARSLLKSVQKQENSNLILNWTLERPELRRQLFQLVDCLPTLQSNRAIAQHIKEYLSQDNPNELPQAIRNIINFQNTDSFQAKTTAITFQQGVKQLGKQFIIGENTTETLKAIQRKTKPHLNFSIDILGEAVVSETEAQHYLDAYEKLLDQLNQETNNIAPQISVKLTALYSRTTPTDPEGSTEVLLQRLRPLLRKAKACGVTIHFDMEDQVYKDLTFQILKTLLTEEEFRQDTKVGITLQAYLKDSEQDLTNLLSWLEKRGTPIIIRLVKGAYWDKEYIKAQQNNWQQKVFTDKAETDRNFENLTETLIKHHHLVFPAIATHNVRSVAKAIAIAEAENIDASRYEFQVLYGMGDSLARTLADKGYQARIYCPQGELLPGMSYLIRRLLENTANTSFLKQRLSASSEALIAPPKPKEPQTCPVFPIINAGDTDYSNQKAYQSQQTILKEIKDQSPQIYDPIINHQRVDTGKRIPSINPSKTSQILGKIGQAQATHAEQAIQACNEAFPSWKATPADKRCEIIHRAANLMEARREELNAWVCLESGKILPQADPEVSEAIDFCRYYANEMAKLAKGHDFSVPGETNLHHYQPRGTAVIISPWNFPIAITTGMTVAALVTGNCAILKPSSNTSIIASKIADILIEAGIPEGVFHFLPGKGSEVGDYLINHPQIQTIAFTGSKAVGNRIIQQAATPHPDSRQIKRVIAEMGGKNGIIIDESADLDEAVKGVITSAFGYSGQKCSACSRVIVLDPVYDSFLERLKEATLSLQVGEADDPKTQVGPVIDQTAYQSINQYLELGNADATLIAQTPNHLSQGFYIPPTIFSDVDSQHPLAQEEIFGPVLTVLRASSFSEAIAIANDTQYGLTGGVYSRTPSHLEQARVQFNVGNLYLNRGITGSIVARQPFGGFKQSGIGSKAGGPDYLIQFMNPRVVTENTQRQGFALL